jgi:hypothetical protein
VLAGTSLTLLIASLIPISIEPSIFGQYWFAVTNYPLGTWVTPTIGSILRLIFGINKEWLQVFPLVIGVIWLIIHYWRHRREWNWLDEAPILIFASFLASPYSWTYDMVILLLPLLQVISNLVQSKWNWSVGLFLTAYVTVDILVLYLHSFLVNFWFIWFIPVMLVWYLLWKKLALKPSPLSVITAR